MAITQRVDVHPERNEWRDALDQRLTDFLISVDVVPIPVPNALLRCGTEHIFDRWLTRTQPNAVVLSGGNDVGKCKDRDETETALLNHAQRYALPVLGICRGMQMMGIWAGATLTKVQGHVKTRHILRHAKATGDLPSDVNSFHDWSLSQCPADFKPLAWSDDGEIEAMRHRVLPWEAWMWHPEREAPFSSIDIARAKALLHG